MYSTAGMKRDVRNVFPQGAAFDLVDLTAAGQIVERRGAFGVEDEVDRVRRKIWQLDRLEPGAVRAEHVERFFEQLVPLFASPARDFGINAAPTTTAAPAAATAELRCLIELFRDVPDLQRRKRRVRIE